MKKRDIDEQSHPDIVESMGERKGYPSNSVIGVLNTRSEAERAIEELRGGGFIDSEIHPLAGQKAADELEATTGRKGLANIAIRVAERLGLTDEEIETKDEYEQALRAGRVLVLVDVPTRTRRDVAARILRANGAHSVNYFGRYTIAQLTPPPESRP